MKRRRLIITLLATLFATPGAGDQSARPLVLERTIALSGVSGRIDHMAVDPAHNRLFVAELGNGTLDIIDLAAGAVVHRIANLREPQGVGYAAGPRIIAVASAGDGSVRMFSADTFATVGTIDLGDDADNVRVDSRTGNLIIGYGSGGLAIVDPVKAALVRHIQLPAHPEGFQLDPGTGRAFVNIPDARQIAVVDIDAGRQTAGWRVPNLRANFPMALDASSGVIASVFRSPPHLVILDVKTGVPAANLESCGDADDVSFDAKRHRIYVSCGEGTVDVWQQRAGGYRHLSPVRTASGARTSLFVPEFDRLFVAARAGFMGLGSAAAILVFRPAD